MGSTEMMMTLCVVDGEDVAVAEVSGAGGEPDAEFFAVVGGDALDAFDQQGAGEDDFFFVAAGVVVGLFVQVAQDFFDDHGGS